MDGDPMFGVNLVASEGNPNQRSLFLINAKEGIIYGSRNEWCSSNFADAEFCARLRVETVVKRDPCTVLGYRLSESGNSCASSFVDSTQLRAALLRRIRCWASAAFVSTTCRTLHSSPRPAAFFCRLAESFIRRESFEINWAKSDVLL